MRYNILFISSPDQTQSGDFIYRVRQPGIALASLDNIRVISCPNISRYRDLLIRNADVVILDMLGDPDLIPWLNRPDLVQIYELSDNLLDIQPFNPCYSFFRNPDNLATIFQLIHLADGIQTTSEYLQGVFRPLFPNITVFKNHLVDLPPTRPKSDPVVLGWGGSYGHRDDVAGIVPVVTEYLRSHPEIRLHIMGAPQIFELFEGVPSCQKSYFPTGSLDQYHRFLDTLHIGLAPLEPTGFNQGRSDIKLLEYLAHGVIPICAAVGPYLGAVEPGINGLLYRMPADIPGLLDRLRAEPALGATIVRQGYEYLRSVRLERPNASQRRDYYLGRLASRLGHLAPPSRTDEDVRCIPEARALATHYYEIEHSNYEQHLYHGLIFQYQKKDDQAALEQYHGAARLEPAQYLPQLYLANVLRNRRELGAAEQAVQQALFLNPRSFQAQILQAQIMIDRGEYGSVCDFLSRTTQHYPLNAKLFYLRGRLAESHEGRVDASRYFEQALTANPFYFKAAGELGRLAYQGQQYQAAVHHLNHYLFFDHDQADYQFYLGCAYVYLRKIEQGRGILEELLRQHPDHAQARQVIALLQSKK